MELAMSDGSRDDPTPAHSEKIPAAAPERPPMWDSRDLLLGHAEAWIVHNEQIYRLRITSAGKLYLTK